MADTQDFAVVLEKSWHRQASCWNDPFTIQNGHYVGHDGFVVPNCFAEFYQRFPAYVADWVRKRTRGFPAGTEAEDWTQELLLFLATLPPDSIHRRNGQEDVIQTFAPTRMHGANEARFRSFINRCLRNKFNTLHTKWRQRPLSNPRNLSLNVEYENGANDEFCHANSGYLRARERRMRERDEQRLRLREFVRKAESTIPGLRQFLGAFVESESWSEARGHLISGEYAATRERIRLLGQRFVKVR